MIYDKNLDPKTVNAMRLVDTDQMNRGNKEQAQAIANPCYTAKFYTTPTTPPFLTIDRRGVIMREHIASESLGKHIYPGWWRYLVVKSGEEVIDDFINESVVHGNSPFIIDTRLSEEWDDYESFKNELPPIPEMQELPPHPMHVDALTHPRH